MTSRTLTSLRHWTSANNLPDFLLHKEKNMFMSLNNNCYVIILFSIECNSQLIIGFWSWSALYCVEAGVQFAVYSESLGPAAKYQQCYSTTEQIKTASKYFLKRLSFVHSPNKTQVELVANTFSEQFLWSSCLLSRNPSVNLPAELLL